MRREILALLIGVGVGSFGAGVGAGYFALNKKLSAKYDEALKAELEATQKFITRYNSYESPAKAVEELIPDTTDDVAVAAASALTSYQTGETTVKVEGLEDKPDLAAVIKNVFDQPQVDPEKPYVIPEHEYMANETDYAQTNLTFFAGDKVLMEDSDSSAINDVDDVVGIVNLRRFGHKSNNEHIVYVRNDKLQTDYEIQRSPGKYTVEVLGETEEDLDG